MEKQNIFDEMLKNLLRLFLDGVIASIIYNFAGFMIVGFLPALPFGISSAIVIGILVVVVDYILQNLLRFK